MFYEASSDDLKKISPLGEQGWDIVNQSPLVVAHPFTMRGDAPIVRQFSEWIGKRATKSLSERKELERRGYSFRRVYKDDTNSVAYEVDVKDGCPLLDWRVEFNVADDPPLLYITFGDMDLNSVAFCDKGVIDKYVPKGILAEALSSGAVRRKYMVMEDEA